MMFRWSGIGIEQVKSPGSTYAMLDTLRLVRLLCNPWVGCWAVPKDGKKEKKEKKEKKGKEDDEEEKKDKKSKKEKKEEKKEESEDVKMEDKKARTKGKGRDWCR